MTNETVKLIHIIIARKKKKDVNRFDDSALIKICLLIYIYIIGEITYKLHAIAITISAIKSTHLSCFFFLFCCSHVSHTINT